MPEGPVRGQVERINVLGVGVSQVNLHAAAGLVDQWIRAKERHYICVTGVHGVMECQQDDELRRIHNAAALVVPDGMPLVWLSWLAGNSQVGRVYGPDLMLACCERSTGQRRHYFYGGAPGVAERLAERLRDRFPDLLVAGMYSPPFRALSDAETLEMTRRINDATPDIVWVGLSTPKQERWMGAHRHALDAPVLVGVGAAFDFHAGLKPQAPRWMQRTGLEWLFRLVTEPRRLWRRYLVNNPRFICRILLQRLGWAKYDL